MTFIDILLMRTFLEQYYFCEGSFEGYILQDHTEGQSILGYMIFLFKITIRIGLRLEL